MRQYSVLGVLCLVAVFGGCRGKPICLATDSRVVVGPPPQPDSKPVVAMPIAGGCCEGPRIALIDVDGLLVNANVTGLNSIGENPVSAFREKLEHVSRSSCYCAVVVRINSPGGGVTASDIMRRELAEFRNRCGLPVIACLMDLGTGGAYYVASAADHIVAHPTTITGGMGVILNLYNLEDTMMQANIEGVPIKAGRYTDLGSPVKAMDPDARDILQQVANEFHARFRQAVSASRPLSLAHENELFDGRIFTAPHATELGLVDSIGYVDDALQLARQLGGAPRASAVILHRPRDPARTVYDITPNMPVQGLFPLSIPGLDRSRLPTFLYLWQPEPTMERLGGM